MIWKALVKSFDSFLRFLDCPEVQSESEAIPEQRDAIVLMNVGIEVILIQCGLDRLTQKIVGVLDYFG